MPTLMERQLDAAAGELLQRDLDARGIAFFTDGQTEEILGTDKAEGVQLADGRRIPADLVVLAIGIRPNIDLARAAGLDVNRGILVGDDMRTSDPDIYAVGECVEHNGQVFGLVAPIWEQAKVCARAARRRRRRPSTSRRRSSPASRSPASMCSRPARSPRPTRPTRRSRCTTPGAASTRRSSCATTGSSARALRRCRRRPLVRAADARQGRRVGAFATSWCSAAPSPSGPAAPAPTIDIAAMPDDEQICGCNGVSQGRASVAAIQRQEARRRSTQVRAHTKASASCGSVHRQGRGAPRHLRPAVDVKRRQEQPMCECTEHGHDEVRQRDPRARSSRPSTRCARRFGWKKPDGCQKCRPALNYYLICAWPGEYRDDAQSRFVNERVHANIQKDGTYWWCRGCGAASPTRASCAPSPMSRRNIAIPTVKVTGGQRIDLLGVKKEELPSVWGDLNKAGLVSGHAYGKALRTVKTCVGSEWCRFGTQDSTGLGVKLEKMCWGSWTPHKVKLAVSGCPRNCAEATIKDIGVVCVEAGYDIVVGGNGGVEVRVTDQLVRVATEEEVLEYVGAFMQLYREEAHYLERTAPWVARVGIDYVRERLVDDADNRARAVRALPALRKLTVQSDPVGEARGAAPRRTNTASLAGSSS